jgi:hypothetical protein
MAVMMSKLYAALRAAGAPDDQAREAAEEAAGFQSPTILGELNLHRWMIATNIVLTVALIGLVLRLGH